MFNIINMLHLKTDIDTMAQRPLRWPCCFIGEIRYPQKVLLLFTPATNLRFYGTCNRLIRTHLLSLRHILPYPGVLTAWNRYGGEKAGVRGTPNWKERKHGMGYIPPGGHDWGYYSGTLSVSSHCNWFENRVPEAAPDLQMSCSDFNQMIHQLVP